MDYKAFYDAVTELLKRWNQNELNPDEFADALESTHQKFCIHEHIETFIQDKESYCLVPYNSHQHKSKTKTEDYCWYT